MERSDNIIARFGEIVAQHPDHPALVAGETLYSYRDLAALSRAYAAFFRDRLSLGPGDVLLAWLNNGPEFVASFLAAAASGAVFFPLNINLRPPELRWFLDRLPVRGVVTRQGLRAPWDALAERISAERVIAVDDPLLAPRLQVVSGLELPPLGGAPAAPDQPAVCFSSSGSTGVPKIVARSHSNTVAGAAATARALGIAPGQRFLSVVPFYHANGFDNSLSLPLFSGATAVLLPDFVPAGFAAELTRGRIRVLMGSPAIFEFLVRFKVDPACLSGLSLCASSGGPIAPETVAAVRDRYGVTIRQVYGSSETGVMAVDGEDGGALPVPGAELKVVGEDGRALPPGEEGEILVRGPMVVKGYVNDPEMTAGAFADGCFHTGDRGRLDACGRLTLLGRIRPVINLSGTKVDPLEVENVLRTLSGVNGCRVFAGKGAQQEQIIQAAISVSEGSTLTRAAVIAHCRQFLAEYKIPRVVELVQALPADLTGKKPVSWVRGDGS